MQRGVQHSHWAWRLRQRHQPLFVKQLSGSAEVEEEESQRLQRIPSVALSSAVTEVGRHYRVNPYKCSHLPFPGPEQHLRANH